MKDQSDKIDGAPPNIDITPEPPPEAGPAVAPSNTDTLPEPSSEPAPKAPGHSCPADALTVGQCFTTLIIGLIPLVGLLACLLWSWGGSSSLGRQNLAKALLWLHGIALCLLIGGLIIWVFSLAGFLSR